jgi:hypothetical protein
MYEMSWYIKIGRYRLGLLDSVEIHSSVDLLADTATIKLSGSAYNSALRIEDKIKRGDKVLIQLGYDGTLRNEFEGFLLSISTDDGSITLQCEDGLFLFRKPVKEKEFKNIGVKQIAEYLITELGGGITLRCDDDVMQYDKFTIYKATGYDVLKKLQEETKANIYMKGAKLHIHPAYIEIFGKVNYDFAVNIEKSDLKYKQKDDRKYEVEVEGIAKNGDRKTVTVGTPGGDKRSLKIYGVTNIASLRKRGEEEMKRIVYDGFEGSIDTWLIPYVSSGYSCLINDNDYDYKKGRYYAVAVTTTFDSNGAVRKIQMGKKLS